MPFVLTNLLLAVALFSFMLACCEIGRRAGLRRLALEPDGHSIGAGPIEGAIFGLLGLILAFTFNGAANRFETRLLQIGDEANEIGTAYQRIDLLPAELQPEFKRLFREYVSTRIVAYEHGPEEGAVALNASRSRALQDEIWTLTQEVSKHPAIQPQTSTLFITAISDIFDIATTRDVAQENHPPQVVYFLLVGLGLLSSLLIGYVMCNTRYRSWFYLVLYSATIATTVFVILDMEYPRQGFIRVDFADQILANLLATMQ